MPNPSRPPLLPGNPMANFRFNPNAILFGAVVLLVVIGAFTCFYQVSAESVGVVQRFGRFSVIAPPGLRFKLPFGIDRVTIVPVARQLKLEFGYGTAGATSYYQQAREVDAERDM